MAIKAIFYYSQLNHLKMKKSMFFITFMLIANFTFSNSQNAGLVVCSAPANVIIISRTSSSVSFDWNDCGCLMPEFRVYYVVNGQSSQEASSSNSGISFSGLSSGSYRFYFYTICGGVASSIIIEDVMIC